MKKDQINFEELTRQVSDQLKSGRSITGKGGALTPLIKQVLEAALETEIQEHVEKTRQSESNRRNGRTQKNLKSSLGGFEIFTPRDRSGSFSPKIIPKRQRNLPGDLDDKILALYSRGMSYRDIRAHVEDLYGIEVSEGTITKITDQIIPMIHQWQERPLERLYPIVWLDAIHFKVRQDGNVRSKALYSVLGINMHGKKEILGLYQGDSESASFWLQVLTELNNRGVEDILIASIDNLKGFAQAIESIYKNTEVQLCVIHQIRNSLKYIPWKSQREFITDLKKVYQAASKKQAEKHLDDLEEKWGKKYPIVLKSWRNNWDRLSNYFKYPKQIRRLVYTTNTVEGYHRQIRKVTKTKGAFTNENALLKLVFLATRNIEKKWQNQIWNWPSVLNQLAIYFEDRIINADTLN